MKKFLVIAAAAAMALTACTKEPALVDPALKDIKTVITADLGQLTKTSIDGVKISWTAGDAVCVNGATSAALTEASSSAQFGFTEVLTPPYKAVYPASLWKDEATISLPAQRSSASLDLPLSGYVASGNSISFSALTAIIRLAVTGDGETLKEVVVSGLGGEQVCGDFTIDYESGALTGAATGDEGKKVTLSCGSVLSSQPQMLYIPVPAGSYSSGVQVDLVSEANGTMRMTTGARTYKAGELRSMPEVAFSANSGGIRNATDFAAFAAAVNAGESTAQWENEEGWVNLLADIDFTGVTDWEPVGHATAPWTSYNPVVTAGHAFTGKFDGGAHHIKNLHLVCNETEPGRHYGLFGYLGEGAIVQNFVIDNNCSLTVSASVSLSAGMVAGVLYDATVRDVTSYAPMTYNGGATGYLHMAMIGGMYSKNVGSILDSVHNYGDILAENTANLDSGATGIHVAGITGFTNAPTGNAFRNVVSACNNYGNMNSQAARTAGIVGAANACTDIVNCENRGDQINSMPKTDGARAGNITCFTNNGSNLSGCKNYGDLVSTTSGRVGGILSLPTAGTYTNCENYGRIISDSQYRGVFFGYVTSAAVWTGCHASGRVGTYNNGDWQYDLYSESNKISYLGKQGNANGSYNEITYDIQTGEDPADPDIAVDADFRIFFIGNSFTKDAVEHLPGILAAAGLNKVQMVHMYYGGRTIPEYNSGWASSTDYHCYICNPGATSWTDITGKSLAQVAVSAKWDVITIQEHTGRLLAWGWTDDEKNAVNGLLSKLKDAQDAQGGTPKYYYILSQAYFDLSKAQNVSKPFSDQAGMWKAISDQARKVMLECTFDGIISTGAMLQNLRTSGINDANGLTRDGYHMNYGIARYGAACTVFESVIGPFNGNVTMDTNSYRYSVTNTTSGSLSTPVTDDNAPVALHAARYAIANPYDVTDMDGEGGSGSGGTDPDPGEHENITVSSLADLLAFATRVNSGDADALTANVTLAADIDCSSVASWEPIGNCTMSTWSHVNLATSGNLFAGTFDGAGHKIKNLAMSFTPSAVNMAWGFFGGLGDGAVVKDLTFDSSCSMHISSAYAGSFGVLAGLAMGVTVDNVKNYAPITGGGTSALPNNTAAGRMMIGGIIGEVHASSVPAALTGLYNAGQIGVSDSDPFSGGANAGNGANGVCLGGIAGFSTNTNNPTTVTFTDCVNDGAIFSSTGRTSGMVSSCNRYTVLKDCINNGDVHCTQSGTFRPANITCIAGPGVVLDGCINKGDLIAPGIVSVAGVVCLVNDASVVIKNCGSIGATLIGKNVKTDGAQTYNGVLYGYFSKTPTLSNCSVSGKIGTSDADLVTLTAENYLQYVGQANSVVTTDSVKFAGD
ncbi:MAG: DUF4886 domain-containing protein [Bacteroidales bacterium]|nr:DUF4886 domain-containing protein [Bacteroidales bacterium]